MKSECSIWLGNNSELGNMLARYRVGDTVELEITGQVRSVSKENVVLDITEVGCEGETMMECEGEGEESGPVTPNAQEPVMVTIMKSRGGDTEIA